MWDQIRVDHGNEFSQLLYVQEKMANYRRNTGRAPFIQTMCKRGKPTQQTHLFLLKRCGKVQESPSRELQRKKQKQNKTFLIIISFSNFFSYIMCIKLQFNRRAIPFCLLLKSFITSLSSFTTFKG